MIIEPKTLFFVIACVISIVWTIALFAVTIKKKMSASSHQTIPMITRLTIGMFFSVWFVNIPVCYFDPTSSGEHILSPMLSSFFNTMRVFILEGDISIILHTISDQKPWLQNLYTIYGSLLLIVAPALTFSNVFYLFNRLNDEIKFSMLSDKPIYIMSELNERSVVLAKSILKKSTSKVHIVFANVSAKCEDEHYDLLCRAKDMKALILKRNIIDLDMNKFRNITEIFFISSDEADNVSKSIAMTKKLNDHMPDKQVKIFTFAGSSGSTYILNSLNYDALMNNAYKYNYDARTFKLRRVDPVQHMVWKEIQKMRLYESAKGKTISILIVGFGVHGMAFFKALFWYCQAVGYRLEINIIDKEGTFGDNSIESVINRQCPELLGYIGRSGDTDMNYSIKCLSGIDINTDALRNMLEYDGKDSELTEIKKRLLRTTTAIVNIGDDDDNIEASVYLRILFDKINNTYDISGIPSEKECPQIYTVVYDDKKNSAVSENSLTDHMKNPYNINCIGSFSSQYSHNNIYEYELESIAFDEHEHWINKELESYNALMKDTKTKEALMEEMRDMEREKKSQFQKYEYYRSSSIARIIHSKAIADLKLTDEAQNISERMRWNAYMMTIGYEYSPVRAERAKKHDKIGPATSRSIKEKRKDEIRSINN